MQADERKRQAIIGQLTAVIAEINRHGLAVLVTLLPPSLQHELPQTYLDGLDGPKFRTYSGAVETIAAALGAVNSSAVALEPMKRAAIGVPDPFRHRLDQLSASHGRAHPPRRAAIAAPPHRRLLVEYRRHRVARHRSVARPAQLRQRAFLLSVPVHASGRELVDALSRRHDRRALSGVGGHARGDAVAHPHTL